MSSPRFKAKPEVVDTDIGGDRALLHLEKNTYFTLNPTAAEVWTAMAQPQTLDALVTVVTEKFEVSAELCRPDVEELLRAMVEADVATEVSA